MAFYYYRGVLRGIWREHRKEEMVFTYTVIGLVLLLSVVSVSVIQPFGVRDVKDTNATLKYVQHVEDRVRLFFDTKKYIPQSLDDLSNLGDPKSWHHDGIYGTAKPVTYERTGRTTFTVCAVFDALPRGTDVHDYYYKNYEVVSIGKNCFDLDIGN